MQITPSLLRFSEHSSHDTLIVVGLGGDLDLYCFWFQPRGLHSPAWISNQSHVVWAENCAGETLVLGKLGYLDKLTSLLGIFHDLFLVYTFRVTGLHQIPCFIQHWGNFWVLILYSFADGLSMELGHFFARWDAS